MSLDSSTSLIDDVKRVLASTLELDDDRTAGLHAGSPLFGELPELDSLAVLELVGALEDQFGIVVEDDDVSAEAFETLGSLAAFVETKRA
jgi:acyl carrier protein